MDLGFAKTLLNIIVINGPAVTDEKIKAAILLNFSSRKLIGLIFFSLFFAHRLIFLIVGRFERSPLPYANKTIKLIIVEIIERAIKPRNGPRKITKAIIQLSPIITPNNEDILKPDMMRNLLFDFFSNVTLL